MYPVFSLLFFGCLLLKSSLFGDETTKTTIEPLHNPFSLQEPPPEVIETHGSFIGEFFYMLLMLGILISIVMFTSWFLKRMLHSRVEQINAASTIKVLEKRSLSQKTHLYLIEHEGKSLLIAETPTHVVPLKFE
jgi:flagellar biogenesis protein FliO